MTMCEQKETENYKRWAIIFVLWALSLYSLFNIMGNIVW